MRNDPLSKNDKLQGFIKNSAKFIINKRNVPVYALLSIVLARTVAGEPVFDMPLLLEDLKVIKTNPELLAYFTLTAYGLKSLVDSQYTQQRHEIADMGMLIDARKELVENSLSSFLPHHRSAYDLDELQATLEKESVSALNATLTKRNISSLKSMGKNGKDGMAALFNKAAKLIGMNRAAAIPEALTGAPLLDLHILATAAKLGQDMSLEAEALRAQLTINVPALQVIFSGADDVSNALLPYRERTEIFFDSLARSMGEDAKYVLEAFKESFSNGQDATTEFHVICGDIIAQAQREASTLVINQKLIEAQTSLSQIFLNDPLPVKAAMQELQAVWAYQQTFLPKVEYANQVWAHQTGLPVEKAPPTSHTPGLEAANAILARYAPILKSAIKAKMSTIDNPEHVAPLDFIRTLSAEQIALLNLTLTADQKATLATPLPLTGLSVSQDTPLEVIQNKALIAATQFCLINNIEKNKAHSTLRNAPHEEGEAPRAAQEIVEGIIAKMRSAAQAATTAPALTPDNANNLSTATPGTGFRR